MTQQSGSFVDPGEHDSIWRAILRAERRLFALEKHQTRARVEMSADNGRLWRQVAELQAANKKLQTQSELLEDRVDNVIELLKIARNGQIRLEEANARLQERIKVLEKQHQRHDEYHEALDERGERLADLKADRE